MNGDPATWTALITTIGAVSTTLITVTGSIIVAMINNRKNHPGNRKRKGT